MTNIERIKAMSAEEMAEIIYSEIVEGVCSKIYYVYNARGKRFLSRKEKIQRWLEREADEDES